jgi:hypothetical protein
MMDLHERIELLVKKADEVGANHWQASGFTHSAPPIHRADFISKKWCRVVTLDDYNGVRKDSSVYCFVCLQDGHTKTLGVLKSGDIHKAAGFTAPAKHARGNVFNDDFVKCLTQYGIVYLK